MKKLIAIVLTITLVAIALTACADLYPETAKVVELDYEADTVTVETFMGFLFMFEGCEDYFEGDCISLIMEDNGTELIYDDKIVMAQFCGWELVNWMER